MKVEIPDFILEMSEQMKKQPNRATAHPYWQVRCKRFEVTEEGYNDHHWVLVDEDGEFFRSDRDCVCEALRERHPEWCRSIEDTTGEAFDETLDIDFGELPDGVNKVFVQEVEQVVTTHLTEHDAKGFIERCQHNYPPLYTYVESAYWSPQIRQLQDWIIALTADTDLSLRS